MRISLKSTALGLAAFGALAIAAPSAWAGCAADASKSPAMFETGKANNSLLIRVANQNSQGGPSIVGLWAVTLTSGGNTVDFGYSEWHADGTEIMNSGGHAASTGNFCLGVWAQTGGNSYHLNHFALAYDPTNWNTGGPFPNPPPANEAGGGLLAKINLIEDVVLAPGGNSFTGRFTQIGYDPNHPGVVLPQFGASGQIVGQRISP
jgi:hypothetical protein